MTTYSIDAVIDSKYIFFTGKGGVGKTSTASATAIGLAETGRKVLLVSTDPASNLEDIFARNLTEGGTVLEEVPGLTIMNLDPIESAARYRESVVGPLRGLLPESAIQNMEEQLSGSCTVEVAAFNEFTNLLWNPDIRSTYDNILFDTAPTGHTLRMIELPSAWTGFLDDNKSGASCLGQLSGLEQNRAVYREAVAILGSPEWTTMVLVARADHSPLAEAERAREELGAMGIRNVALVLNGLVGEASDPLLHAVARKQQHALAVMPKGLKAVPTYVIPLRSYDISSVKNLRAMLKSPEGERAVHTETDFDLALPAELVKGIRDSNTKVLFTMGKGGVGKTTVASALALHLAAMGMKVHLTTTDPANHLGLLLSEGENLTITAIDEEKELEDYKQEALSKAVDASPEDLEYLEEDLRSPCTQEIAVFRKFAKIVQGSGEDIVIIDTAPTGHTLLLLDSTQSYHKEVERGQGAVPPEVRDLLPRLRSKEETKVVIVTLAEPTPFHEAKRLQEDLERAGIGVHRWVLNQSFFVKDPKDPFLKTKAQSEAKWIAEVDRLTKGAFYVLPWQEEEMSEDRLMALFG